MRMIAAATLILLPLSASAQPTRMDAPPAPRAARADRPAPCSPFARTERAQALGGAMLLQPSSRAQRLAELPAGDLVLAVQRQINGCVEPVIVRQGVGAFEAPPARR